MQTTSLHAYYSEIQPTLGGRQEAVYEEICKHVNITNTELALALKWPINTVTPRVKELRDARLVSEWGKRVCKVTGRTVIAWEQVRLTLF